MYCSLKYRLLLKRFLGAEDYYLVAKRRGEVVGVLPSFLSGYGPYGRILNSLPFYGSYGGVIVGHGDDEAAVALLSEWRGLAEQPTVAASTIVSSPFDKDTRRYEEHTTHTDREARLGQVTRLVPADASDIGAALMARYHPKTRNMVRKASKMGITINHDESDGAIEFLIATHHENMKSIGGLAKPARFFSEVRRVFEYGRDYRVYTATIDARPIAAMLCFYCNATVEYFPPVVLAEWRSQQPLSLIIHEAMRDASREGFEYWNWGGTWLTQDGVYHFKKRWGSEDLPYYYYTTLRNQELLHANRETLLDGYPFFYVLPFSRLRAPVTASSGGDR